MRMSGFIPLKKTLTKEKKKGLEKPTKPKRRTKNPWIKGRKDE